VLSTAGWFAFFSFETLFCLFDDANPRVELHLNAMQGHS
jgi:hypothetical protein